VLKRAHPSLFYTAISSLYYFRVITREITDNISQLLSCALTCMFVTIDLAVVGSNKRDGELGNYNEESNIG